MSAAAGGQLPLSASNNTTGGVTQLDNSSCSWCGASLQSVLAAVADVWLAAGCPELVLSMLDALAGAGVMQLDNPQLARAVEQDQLNW